VILAPHAQAAQRDTWQKAIGAIGQGSAGPEASMVSWAEGDAVKEPALRSSLTFARRGISILQHAP